MKKTLVAIPLALTLLGLSLSGCSSPDQSTISETDRKRVGGDMAGRPADLGEKMREAKEKYDKAHPKTYFGPDSHDSGSSALPPQGKS